MNTVADSKVHWANKGPTWVLPAPGGSHVGPKDLAIWGKLDHSQNFITPWMDEWEKYGPFSNYV